MTSDEKNGAAPAAPHPDWKNPDADLVVDGNALSILGFVASALRRAGNSPEVVAAYREEATSGDYDHLLYVSMLYAGTFG